MTEKVTKQTSKLTRWYIFIIPLFSLVFIVLGSLPVFGQSAVEITHERGNNGEYTFTATSMTSTPYIVFIDFNRLTNLNSSRNLPHIANVKGNRSRLLVLEPIVENQRTNFSYHYRYLPGCLNTTPDEIEYLLPFEENAVAKAGFSSFVYEIIGREEPENWYSMIFYVEDETPVHAARKGIVVSVQDKNNKPNPDLLFSSGSNQITVVHDDCTFARYSVFKNHEIYVEPGDVVYPGDLLGIVAGEEIGFGNQVRFQIYYVNDDHVFTDDHTNSNLSRWIYVQPVFRAAAGERVTLENGNEYKSVHSEELIIKEMTRRERRRWNRQN